MGTLKYTKDPDITAGYSNHAKGKKNPKDSKKQKKNKDRENPKYSD